MIKKIVSSIVVDGITDRATSFVDKQIDVDQKRERLNELLLQINSAIELAKAREPIQNKWLCKWLEDLEKASREGAELQSVFEEQKVANDMTNMNLLKFPIRFFQQRKSIDRLLNAVMRLERKASGCEEFLRRLRYEFEEQRYDTYTKKMGKLEKTVARLRKGFRSLNSSGKFKRSKKTKLPHGPRRAGSTLIPSQPELRYQNHDEPENIIFHPALRDQNLLNSDWGDQNHDEPKNIVSQPELRGQNHDGPESIVSQPELRDQNHNEPENIEDATSEQANVPSESVAPEIGPSTHVLHKPEEGEENDHCTVPSNSTVISPNFETSGIYNCYSVSDSSDIFSGYKKLGIQDSLTPPSHHDVVYLSGSRNHKKTFVKHSSDSSCASSPPHLPQQAPKNKPRIIKRLCCMIIKFE